MTMKTRILLLLMLLPMASAEARRLTVACKFAADGRHVYEDSCVVMQLTVVPHAGVCIEVHNKTAGVVYVDRQLSFAYVNGGSWPLYAASSVTDGVVNALATMDDFHNVRYIDGHVYSHYTTVTEQPVQAVAPMGTAIVCGWEELEMLMEPSRVCVCEHGPLSLCRRSACFVDGGREQRMHKGDSRIYDETTTPLFLAVSMRYATDAAPDVQHTAYVSDYVRQIDVHKHGAWDSDRGNLPLASRQYLFDCGGVNVPAVVTYGLTLAAAAAFVAVWTANDIDMDMPSGF